MFSGEFGGWNIKGINDVYYIGILDGNVEVNIIKIKLLFIRSGIVKKTLIINKFRKEIKLKFIYFTNDHYKYSFKFIKFIWIATYISYFKILLFWNIINLI